MKNFKSFLALAMWAAAPAFAKSSTYEIPQNISSSPLSMMGILAALSLVPFALVMLTSFSKISVVLSLTRSALGTQQAPPTIVLTGLALVLSITIMTPTLERMHRIGTSVSAPNNMEGIYDRVAASVVPLKDFLVKHGSADERARFVDMSRELRPVDEASLVHETDWGIVLPAFVLTELKEAFTLGFLVFLPFLVLDMLVANVLLALGMQTLTPTQVSLPFKLLLFVAVDGWSLLAHGLIAGYR